MTVYEHLIFYAMVKRVPVGEEDQAATAKISQVGLEEKRDCFARTLSGGMKRKLQVGCRLTLILSILPQPFNPVPASPVHSLTNRDFGAVF